MTFLLLFILIVLFLMPLLSVIRAYNRMRYHAKKNFEQFFNQQRQYSDYQQEEPTWQRKKKIDSSIGEYIEYEDIEVSEETVTAETSTTTTDTYRTNSYDEPQVSDAEWEDIP